MAKVRRLILVTATHHPHHSLWVKLTEDLSSELGVEREVREEDYVFLIEHGETDEFGMAWAPQLVAELDDGGYLLLLSKMPFNEFLQPDLSKAKEEALSKLRVLSGE